MQMYFKEGTKFLPHQAAEFGRLGHVFLALQSRIQERAYGIVLYG